MDVHVWSWTPFHIIAILGQIIVQCCVCYSHSWQNQMDCFHCIWLAWSKEKKLQCFQCAWLETINAWLLNVNEGQRLLLTHGNVLMLLQERPTFLRVAQSLGLNWAWEPHVRALASAMERLEVRLEIKERRESIAGEHGSGGTWVLQRNWETKIERKKLKYYNPYTYCLDRLLHLQIEHSGVDPSGQCFCCASTDLAQ